MTCSAVTLSIATVLSVIAVACLSVGFSTDNWYEIRVDANMTRHLLEQLHGAGSIPEDLDSNPLYYSRDEGLFRVCFADKKPKEGKKFVFFSRFSISYLNLSRPFFVYFHFVSFLSLFSISLSFKF